jgi:hypothetical protein
MYRFCAGVLCGSEMAERFDFGVASTPIPVGGGWIRDRLIRYVLRPDGGDSAKFGVKSDS